MNLKIQPNTPNIKEMVELGEELKLPANLLEGKEKLVNIVRTTFGKGSVVDDAITGIRRGRGLGERKISLVNKTRGALSSERASILAATILKRAFPRPRLG